MLYRSVTHLALLLVLLFLVLRVFLFFFFFNDTATTEIYTLSLHDALPIYVRVSAYRRPDLGRGRHAYSWLPARWHRSEEHTSELQSLTNLVCRLLLEKKKKKTNTYYNQPSLT